MEGLEKVASLVAGDRRDRSEDAAHGRARLAAGDRSAAAANRGGSADRARQRGSRRLRDEEWRLRLHREAGQSGPAAQRADERRAAARHGTRTGSDAPQVARCRSSGIAGRHVEEDAGDLPADRDGRAEHGVSSDHRRERHGQRDGGADDPRSEPAQRTSPSSRSTARRFPRA